MEFNQRALNCALRAAYWGVVYWKTDAAPSKELADYTKAQLIAAKPLFEWAESMDLYEAAVAASKKITRSPAAFDEALWEMVGVLDTYRKEILAEPTVKPSAVRILNAMVTYQRTGSDSSLARLVQGASALAAPLIIQGLHSDLEVPDEGQPQLSELKKLVKKLGGSRYLEYLTINEMGELRNGTPAQQAGLKEYQKLSKEATASYKTAVKSIVGGGGEQHMDCKEVVKQLKAAGITRIGIPEGFVGRIDADGRLYTTKGDRLAMNPTCPSVTMNPKFTGKDRLAYCFGAWPDAIRASTGKLQLTSYQTEKQTQQRVVHKNEKISKAIDKIAKMSKAWQALLKSRDPEKQALGAALQFMYSCSQRIGSLYTQSKGGATFGATTFEMRHVIKTTKSEIHIRFPTKADGLQNLVLKSTDGDVHQKLLFKLMAEKFCSPEKKKADPTATAWTYPGGAINGQAINKWLKKFDKDFTSHMFRSLNASTKMAELLEKDAPTEPNQKGKTDREYSREMAQYTKDVTNHFYACATEVGKMLGHFRKDTPTPMTAIGSYIGSNITTGYFQSMGIPVPAKVASAIKESKDLE